MRSELPPIGVSANQATLDQRIKTRLGGSSPDQNSGNAAFAYVVIDHFNSIANSHDPRTINKCLFHVLHAIRASAGSDCIIGQIDRGELLVAIPSCTKSGAEDYMTEAKQHLRYTHNFLDEPLQLTTVVLGWEDGLKNGAFSTAALLEKARKRLTRVFSSRIFLNSE